MHIVAANAHENRMSASAVAACMAPLLLHPLLAGECELDDDFDLNGDSSAQLLAAANAANYAQSIISTLLEEYGSIFDILYREGNLQICSLLDDSSGSDDSSDDGLDPKDNGYHDAENDVDPERDEDPRLTNGKLSETSHYERGGDIYAYKAFSSDDSDSGHDRDKHAIIRSSNLLFHPQAEALGDSVRDQHNHQMKEMDDSAHESAIQIVLPTGEQSQSVGEVLSSIRPGHLLPVSGLDGCSSRTSGKHSGSNSNVKQSAFWDRNNGRKTLSVESMDSNGEEEVAIQRLEVTKNDLRQRIAKEARENAILQASLERRKQALHERRLALQQDVTRLQEQMQAERDLRAALKGGLSLSSGQLSNSLGMDSKTKAELEDIALAEVDVARLKQKVALLNSEGLQQDFNSTLSCYSHERKQRNEETLVGDSRNLRGQVTAGGSNSKLPLPSEKKFHDSTPLTVSCLCHQKKKFHDSTPLSDTRSTEASRSLSAPFTSRDTTEANPECPKHNLSAATSTLVELTARLDFFKERRSQLIEQLHNLYGNYGNAASSQDFIFKPPSPSWS